MEFHNKQPIYLQIVEMICEKILRKEWLEGERLPSVRELAVSVEVNPNTAMRSYAFLQEKGIIQNKRGIGYFVSDHAFDDTLAFMKSNFIKNDLPLFFKAMRLINMDINELKERFVIFEKNEVKDEDK